MELIEQRVNKLLSQMTLDEKLARWAPIGCSTFKPMVRSIGKRLQILQAWDWTDYGLAGASTLDPINAAIASNSLQKLLIEKTRTWNPSHYS